jgi:anti-sigma regulatory factor (Ser/Thr protein kinase)
MIMKLASPYAILSPIVAGEPVRTGDDAVCALRGRPESVKLARDFARETLQAWGLAWLCDDVATVVSELVTNALNHGMSCGLPPAALSPWARPIQLTLTAQLAHVLCQVRDPGGGAPVLREPDYLRESGRGLHVVESCSERWGWGRLDGGGKVIWAAFRVRH